MNITRDNYEEFFMLYADNELSVADITRVEAFMAANPDLAAELEFFQQAKLQPDEKLVFPGKLELLRQETGEEAISLENFTSFFVLYGDDELNNQQKMQVEDFVYRHPQTQAAFEALLQAKLAPDSSVVFENKESLYRKEEDDKVVPFGWWKLAAAAMILLLLGAFWMYRSKNNHAAELAGTKQSANPARAQELKQPNSVNIENNKQEAASRQLAVTGRTPAVQQVKKAVVGQAWSKNDRRKSQDARVVPGPQVQPELVADVVPDKLKASNIPSIKKDNSAGLEVNKDLAAARSIPDQPMHILHSEEDSRIKAEWASAAGSDNVEVLNTSVNTKNSMRGFFRKASRLISKKTSLGTEEGNRKGILIGGFEIAVR